MNSALDSLSANSSRNALGYVAGMALVLGLWTANVVFSHHDAAPAAVAQVALADAAVK